MQFVGYCIMGRPLRIGAKLTLAESCGLWLMVAVGWLGCSSAICWPNISGCTSRLCRWGYSSIVIRGIIENNDVWFCFGLLACCCKCSGCFPQLLSFRLSFAVVCIQEVSFSSMAMMYAMPLLPHIGAQLAISCCIAGPSQGQTSPKSH